MQNIGGAILSLGDAPTLPEISFILQPFCFDLHYSSCVFGCVNVLPLRHNHILLVGGGSSLPPVHTYFSCYLLASYIYPISLAGCSLHSWGKTSFPRCIHWLQHPENRFHWHGLSLAQSPAIWSPSWRSCQTEKITFPEDSVFAVQQKGFTGSRTSSWNQAEHRLPVGAGTVVKCQDPRAIQVKYSVDTVNEIWGSGFYGHFLMSPLKYSS